MNRLIFTFGLSLLLFSNLIAQPGLWYPYTNLSNNNYGSGRQSIAIGSDNVIHVAWSDKSRLGGGVDEDDILYSQYDGNEWSQPVQLSAYEVTASLYPRIAVDSQNIPHVVWTHNGFSSPEIYYAVRTTTGWSAPLNLSQNPLPSKDADIGIDSQDHIHVVWSDGYYGTMDIFHREFDGFAWLPIDTVFQGYYSYSEIRMVIDSQDRIHITWQDYGNFGAMHEIGYSVFDGFSWSEPENISNYPEESSTNPDIALDGNDHPHIVWGQVVDPGNIKEIYYSFFNGLDWSLPQNVTNLSMGCAYPSFEITEFGIRHLLFMYEDQFGDTYTYYMYCQDDVWSEPYNVIYNGTSDLAIGEGNVVHVALSSMIWVGNSDVFYTYTTAGTVSLVAGLIPESPSITIPSAGGSFAFDVEISNVQVVPITFDVWIDVVLPNGSVYGPIILREDIEMPAGGSIQRTDLQQTIPAGAPPGEYSYRLQLGSYADNVIVSADSFAFYKEGVSSSAGGDWSLSGWDEHPDGNAEIQNSPQECITIENYPNPFNAVATISYSLPEYSFVELKVYDITGKMISMLVSEHQSEGCHEAEFDAQRLASGVYIYRLKTGHNLISRKMVLVK